MTSSALNLTLFSVPFSTPDPNLLYIDTAESTLYYTDNANITPLEISGIGGPEN